MSVVNMAQNIKNIHPDYMIMYKVGSFYNCYGKDAYIASYLFEYKIRLIENNITVIGFSKNAISKVIAKIEREKINYILIDTKNNYDIDLKEEFGNLNKYNDVVCKAKEVVNIRIRIEKIEKELLKKENYNKIKKIEEIIYENRKV